MCWHKWSKWEIIDDEVITRHRKDTPNDRYAEKIRVFTQKRTCNKCGAIRIEVRQKEIV
jgi:hypothetical protein